MLLAPILRLATLVALWSWVAGLCMNVVGSRSLMRHIPRPRSMDFSPPPLLRQVAVGAEDFGQLPMNTQDVDFFLSTMMSIRMFVVTPFKIDVIYHQYLEEAQQEVFGCVFAPTIGIKVENLEPVGRMDIYAIEDKNNPDGLPLLSRLLSNAGIQNVHTINMSKALVVAINIPSELLVDIPVSILPTTEHWWGLPKRNPTLFSSPTQLLHGHHQLLRTCESCSLKKRKCNHEDGTLLCLSCTNAEQCKPGPAEFKYRLYTVLLQLGQDFQCLDPLLQYSLCSNMRRIGAGKIIPIKGEHMTMAQKFVYHGEPTDNEPIRLRMKNECDAYRLVDVSFGAITVKDSINCADLFYMGNVYNKTNKRILASHLGFTNPRVAVSTMNMAFSHPGVVVYIDCMILSLCGEEKHGRFMLMVEIKSKDQLTISHGWKW